MAVLAVLPAAAEARDQQPVIATSQPAGSPLALTSLLQPATAPSQTVGPPDADEPLEDPAELGAEAQVPPPPALRARFAFSQFLDAPIAGDADGTLRYGGKLDAYLDIDDAALGLDEGLTLHVHPEFKYGESANGAVGLLPVNTALFYPGAGDVFDLSINLRKRWAGGTSLTVGKVNVLDLAARAPIIGGGGHEGFSNLAFALPPSAVVPASITGALLDVPTKGAIYRLWVFDPDVQSRRSGLEDPFSTGVGMLASITVPVKLGGQQGYYAVKVSASTRSGIADDALPELLVPAPGSGFGEDRAGEYSIVLAGLQTVATHEGGGSIGVFAQGYVSGGDPTFFDWSAIAGISGNPAARPDDSFGIGWFRYSLTDSLVDALANRLTFEDEEGVELFYTAALSKRLRLTANVQLVDSTIVSRRTGATTGLRLSARF